MKKFCILASGLGVLVFTSVACKKGSKSGITYEEISYEQSIADLKVAFADKGDPISVEAEVDDFFKRLGVACGSKGAFDLEKFISVDAMIETLEAGGGLQGFGPKERRDCIAGFRAGMNNAARNFKNMAYDSHRIVRVERPAHNRRIVYVLHYHEAMNVSTKMRWWLIKTDAGWRIHDYEDLTVGLRSVGLMLTLMKAGVAKTPEPWVADFLTLAKLVKTTDFQDAESIKKLRNPVDSLMTHALPEGIKRYGSVISVTVSMSGEEWDKADKEIADAIAGGYDSPITSYQKGHLLMAREKWEEALIELNKNAEMMGADADLLETVAECHFSLGDFTKARDAAIQGLDDNSQSLNCLMWLAAASNQDEMAHADFLKRFNDYEDPLVAYESSLDLLVLLQDKARLERFLGFCRGKLGDETVSYYEEVIKGMDEEE